MAPSTPLLVMVLMGCTSEVVYADTPKTVESYEALMSECAPAGFDPAFYWAEGGEWSGEEVSEECARIAGGSIGLDWESFDDQPHQFVRPSTRVERLILGVLMMIGTGGRTATEVFGGEAPPALVETMDMVTEHAGLSASADAGELWYAFLYLAVDKTMYDPTLTPDTGALMFFNNGVVRVGDIGGDYADSAYWWGDPTGIDYAGYLAHEASHEWLPPHVECAGDSRRICDEDSGGANGAEAWWRFNWQLGAAGVIAESNCERAAGLIDAACEKVISAGDFGACLPELRPDCA